MRLGPLAFVLLGACSAAVARTGTGPGGYGWKDCEEPDGPACDYVIAAVSDGSTGLCSDEVYAPPGGFGFSFPFYGTTFATYAVSANGIVYLSNQPGCCDDVDAPLTGAEGSSMIAPLWDDWAMDNDDELAVICAADPGCSNSGPLTFVESFRLGSGVDGSGVRYRDVEWFDTAHHHPTCTEPLTATFGVRFYEDGRILFNYADVDLADPALDAGASATIGVSRGFLGERTQVSAGAAFVPYVPYALLFTPPCPALRCNSVTAPRDTCEGDVATFRANVGGGVPPYDVSWDFDGDTLPDGAGNPIDHALPAGVHVVTALVSDQCATPGPSSCRVSTTVDAHALPVPVVTPQGATTFCGADGESVTLLADVGYASYQWARDGGDLGGATTRTLDVNVSGSYTVRVTDAFGCTGTSAPTLVDANDCTAACTGLTCDGVRVSPDPACEGSQVSLTAFFTGGEGAIVVGWDLDGDTLADVTGNPLRRVFGAGTTSVTAIVTDSCALPAPQSCASAAVVTVNVTPSPDVVALGPATFCAARGESVTLDAGGGWATYAWTLDGSAIPGSSSTLVAAASGSYAVTVTDAAGCSGTSLPVDVVADDCPSPCAPMTCGLVTVDPPSTCEGASQTLTLEVTGGEAPVGVAWDLDGDTVPDAAGNPVVVTMPRGTHRVHAVAADACADPQPQSCDAFADVDVRVPASALTEVSGPGDLPMLVSRGEVFDFKAQADATVYHANVGPIGTWWRSDDATGRACALVPSGAGARPGTVTVALTVPVNSWIVVTAANTCGEGTPGFSSLGVERSSDVRLVRCGP